MALFLLLLLRGMSIAVRARDKFGALLVVGFVVQVTLQAILNMAVVTNTIPNTGISLPFFSSGGTSLLMLLGEMGIVLSVSRQRIWRREHSLGHLPRRGRQGRPNICSTFFHTPTVATAGVLFYN